MHDTTAGTHWHEPKAGENAGLGKFKRAPMPYDRFMEGEGVPIYRSIGARRMRRSDHARMAEMDAIEIAERDRGAAGIRRQPLPVGEDPHQPRIGTRTTASFSITTTSFTPSA